MLFTANIHALPLPAAQKTVVFMRLAALACLIAVLTPAVLVLGISLPALPLAGTLAALLLFNTWCLYRSRRLAQAGEGFIFVQLFADILALSAMLYFSGGATNPFVSFYLPAVALAAALLRWQFALSLAICAVGAYSLLTALYQPLHLGDPDRAISYHLAGMWANFAVSALLITWFVVRLSHAIRRRDAELEEARVRQLQDERLLALGIQAANAAHELGTPLATIAIIASELRHEVGSLHKTEDRVGTMPAFLHEELTIIEEQVALCKAALERMGKPPEGTPQGAMLDQWFAQFLDRWRLRHPAAELHADIAALAVQTARPEELAGILTTLLDNAAQAVAGSEGLVHARLCLEQGRLRFHILDDGAGIASTLLPQLGHHQVPSKQGRGIGLLLAFASARRIGATIELTSTPGQGTSAVLTLP